MTTTTRPPSVAAAGSVIRTLADNSDAKSVGCPSPTQPVLLRDSASIPFTAYEPDMLILVGSNAKLVPGMYRIDVQVGYGNLLQCALLSDVHPLSSATFEVMDN